MNWVPQRAGALTTLILAVTTVPPAAAQTDVEMVGRMLSGARPPASYYLEKVRNPRAFEFSGEGRLPPDWDRKG